MMMNMDGFLAPASPSGRPPRVTRLVTAVASPLALPGLALVAALDDATAAAAEAPRARSDTFDGLYALDDGGVDVDDVDMDDLAEIDCVDDADVFRPSALLDRKLEEVYGRASDLEAMLGLRGPGDDDDDAMAPPLGDDSGSGDAEAEAVMRHLAQLDEQAIAAATPLQPVVVASGGRVIVPPRETATLPARGRHWEIATAALPPKYAADGATRRAHKRTFGERATPFRFGFAEPTASTSPPAAPPTPSSPAVSAKAVKTATSDSPTKSRRSRSLFHEAAEEIAQRDLGRDDKENCPPHEQLQHAEDTEDTESEAEHDTARRAVEIKVEPPQEQELPVAVHTPLRVSATCSAFHTPVRPTANAFAAASAGLHFYQHTQLDAASFMTPSASSSSSYSLLTPTTSTVATSISPARSFDKVAVVHAKDTPGKVDKFEWTIRGGVRRPAHEAKQIMEEAVTAGLSPVGRAVANGGADASTLPPRYFRDSTSSPQKRRAHSTTFGTFARSFSFTTL